MLTTANTMCKHYNVMVEDMEIENCRVSAVGDDTRYPEGSVEFNRG